MKKPSKNPKIFIVTEIISDYQKIITVLHSKKMDNIKVFHSSRECIAHLSERPEIVLLDYRIEGINSLPVLKKMKSVYPDLDVIIIYEKENLAIDSLTKSEHTYAIKRENAFNKVGRLLGNIYETNMQMFERMLYRRIAGLSFAFILILTVVVVVFNMFYPHVFNR